MRKRSGGKRTRTRREGGREAGGDKRRDGMGYSERFSSTQKRIGNRRKKRNGCGKRSLETTNINHRQEKDAILEGKRERGGINSTHTE